jgi:leucyl/phenylalanyl-tRNA--protein transferase
MPVWSLPQQIVFPHPLSASPEGILAIGGDLSLERLKLAYAFGIFPWYSSNEPILWWFPDPRCVLEPRGILVSKSMHRFIKKASFRVTFDTAFDRVIVQCRNIERKGETGTWIQPEMIEAYVALHEEGYAHSVEIWLENALVGGLYGVAYGKVFFGESMFSVVSNASKYALIMLTGFLEKKGFWLIDCQQDTPHMRSMGAGLISGRKFHHLLQENRLVGNEPGKWTII